MSLILKGIDLPEEGKQITLAIFPDGDIVSYKYWLPKDSQAIQIPEGHGNLKDENEIIKRLEEKEKEPLYQHDTDDWWVGIIDAETVVYTAPTILEAESEE